MSPWGWKLQNRRFLSFHPSFLLSSPISSGNWMNHQGDLSGKQRPTCFSPLLIMSWVSSKLGQFGEAHGEFRPTRLPPLQCAFKSFQDNDIMRKMPVSCCLDKFWERCASSHCSASLQVGKLDTVGSIPHLSEGAVTTLQEVAWFTGMPDSSQHLHLFLLTWWWSGRSWMLEHFH